MLIPRIPVTWYAIAALSLALAGSGLLLKRAFTQAGASKAQIQALNTTLVRAQEQRALDQATLDRLARKNAATSRENALARASLQRSLTANREWSSTPVPKEVQDALR